MGRYGHGNPSTRKEYFVNQEALYVTVEFFMYEIGDWSPDDKLVVKVENQGIDLGQFSGSTTQNENYNGSVGGIIFSRRSWGAKTNIAFGESYDQIHNVSLTIPSSYFSEDGTYVITEENFDFNDGSWKNMEIETFANYGNALSTYDTNGNYPSKSFQVPLVAEQIVIALDLFERNVPGNVPSSQDDFFAIINNVIVPFELFTEKEQTNSNGDHIFSSGKEGGIELSRQSTHISNGILHSVLITVPNKFFKQGNIDFEVLLSLNEKTLGPHQSFGIGKFRIEAHGICRRRSLTAHIDGGYNSELQKEQEQNNNNKDNVPGVDSEEGPYCLAKDYPCDGGDNMVYACHYSGRQGYQTFCIPENDSEILRFYAKDYCGPCVGGYGGVDWST